MGSSPTEDILPTIRFQWELSSERQKLGWDLTAAGPPTDTCARCLSLDVPSWLESAPPFHDEEERERECRKHPKLYSVQALPREPCDTPVEQAQSMFKSLGRAESVEFDSRCGLCRCIFYICPSPSSRKQSITLVLSWTAFRLGSLCRIEAAGMTKSSRMVTVILEPFPAHVQPTSRIMRESDGLLAAEGQDS
jgi:hypothetical protein